MFNPELAQQDREIERRLHHDDFIRRKPEYLDLERERACRELFRELNEAESKALTALHDKAEVRKFTGEPITGFGGLVWDEQCAAMDETAGIA